MRKVVLSVNSNPDYLFFLPLTVWCWRKLNWEPIVFYHGGKSNDDLLWLTFDYIDKDYSIRLHAISDIDGYRSDTLTQVSRLYAACIEQDFIMTSDIDMIPLFDYWHGDLNEITVWGHDLTGYKHYPICYIGMSHTRWIEVMGLSSPDYNKLIKRDLDTLPQAKDPDFYKYWFSDQDLITQRIDQTEFPVTKINRGQYKNGFAVGRVDRGAWTLDHKQFIDAHLHHQIYHKGNEWKFNQTLDLLYKVWPDEDFGWFVEYHHKFKKLTGHA